MENWLERFYTQTDPVKRQQLLSENEGETEREEARRVNSSGRPDMVKESRGRMRTSVT